MRMNTRQAGTVDLTAQRSALQNMRFNGSSELIADTSGEINAGSKKELLGRLLEIAEMIGNGSVNQEIASSRDNTRHAVQLRREAIEAAFADDTQTVLKELGATLSAEITSRLERGGFFRRMLGRAEVAKGGIPRIRLKEPLVNAIVTHGATQVGHQVIRAKYYYPVEFNIIANPRATEIDLNQGADDLLEDMRMSALESIMVGEDRLVLKQLHAAASLYNDVTYFTGQLTPTVVATVQEKVATWRLPALNMLISLDLIKDINAGNSFNELLDPVSRLETIQTGMLGTIFGMAVATDGFRDPRLKVLGAGEVLVTSTPGMIGAYSERGPVQAEPRVNDKDFPGRGWFMYETISSSVVNGRGVARAKRI